MIFHPLFRRQLIYLVCVSGIHCQARVIMYYQKTLYKKLKNPLTIISTYSANWPPKIERKLRKLILELHPFSTEPWLWEVHITPQGKRLEIGHAKYFQALGISCFQWGQYVSMFFLAGTNCRREWGKLYKWGNKCGSITLVPLDVAWASFFVRFQHEPNAPKISSVRIPAPQIPATLLIQPNLWFYIIDMRFLGNPLHLHKTPPPRPKGSSSTKSTSHMSCVTPMAVTSLRRLHFQAHHARFATKGAAVGVGVGVWVSRLRVHLVSSSNHVSLETSIKLACFSLWLMFQLQ